MGSSNVSAHILSRPNQVIGSEWTLHQEVVDHLVHKWPAVIDLFATSLTARLPVYFSPASRFEGGGDGRSSLALGQPPSLCLSSDRHHKESSCQTEVFEELRVDSHRSVLASEGLVPGPSGTVVRSSHSAATLKRSSKTAPLPSLSSKSAYASADCMATIKRFARQAGFSSTVAGQLVFCRRQSTRLNYQARWGTYRKWCRNFGHRSSSPSISKIAKFLTLSVQAQRGCLLYHQRI